MARIHCLGVATGGAVMASAFEATRLGVPYVWWLGAVGVVGGILYDRPWRRANTDSSVRKPLSRRSLVVALVMLVAIGAGFLFARWRSGDDRAVRWVVLACMLAAPFGLWFGDRYRRRFSSSL